MNKAGFIKKLSEKLECNEERARAIDDIIEDTFIVGKKNKEKMVADFEEKLDVSEEEAEKIYETAMEIIGSSIKDKLKNPFKD